MVSQKRNVIEEKDKRSYFRVFLRFKNVKKSENMTACC
ncbi:hypothetical protein appser12_19780 [Actinobacillus pleuropneumoniae serovar 12 str. 1096]|nr:hypothetical protein appser4_19700 [Actinobacillus pleuropneumoniae serovar 4 str. M62]EFM99646.1 hypothetical protein appser12_19780 [Actinobacillus pleuropneumoniae serovar 12 str. 1096]